MGDEERGVEVWMLVGVGGLQLLRSLEAKLTPHFGASGLTWS